MTHTTNSTSRPRAAILAGTAVIAIAAIVYFSFFYPPTPSNEVSGTIGAVKKYRSEQITDKDVQLATEQSEAITAEMAADNQSANQLAASANALEKSYTELSKNYSLDKSFNEQLARTISLSKTIADEALAQRQAVTLNKDAQYSKSVAPELAKQTKPFDRTAADALARNIGALDAKIQELAVRPALDRTVAMNKNISLDKTISYTLSKSAEQLEKQASTYQKTFGVTLDKQTTMDNRSKDILSNQSKMDNKAQ